MIARLDPFFSVYNSLANPSIIPELKCAMERNMPERSIFNGKINKDTNINKPAKKPPDNLNNIVLISASLIISASTYDSEKNDI